MRLLVIEDNQDLAANLIDYLEDQGHEVDAAADGITGLHLAIQNEYEAIVLDLMLPGMDGLTLCRKLRGEANKATPVLILTARDSLEDKIAGLEAGADDYVIKPFALREVVARLHTISRRTQPKGVIPRLAVGDLVFDTATYRVIRGNRLILLPPIPLKILEVFMRSSPRVVTRRELESAVWGGDPPDSDALKAHIHILRCAMDKPFEKTLLHTIRGVGYQMVNPDETLP